jgi:hypothetical protein
MSSACVGENTVVHVEKIYGTKVNGIKLGRRIGLPTINLLLDSYMECGIYDAKSYHGPATIIIGNSDGRKAFVNFMIFKDEINSVDRFEFWDLVRIVNKDSEFVSTYNNGCCIYK